MEKNKSLKLSCHNCPYCIDRGGNYCDLLCKKLHPYMRRGTKLKECPVVTEPDGCLPEAWFHFRPDRVKMTAPIDGDIIRFRVGDNIPGSAWRTSRDKNTGEIVLRYSADDEYETRMLELFESQLG